MADSVGTEGKIQSLFNGLMFWKRDTQPEPTSPKPEDQSSEAEESSPSNPDDQQTEKTNVARDEQQANVDLEPVAAPASRSEKPAATPPMKSKKPMPSPARAYMDADKARPLIGKSEYKKAALLLENPHILQGEDTSPKLMLAECYLHMEMKDKAIKTMEAVRETLMTSSDLKTDDVIDYAQNFMKNMLPFRAIILLRIASDMFENSNSKPDNLVKGVYTCLWKTHNATKPIIKAGGKMLQVEQAIEFMREMKAKVEAVEGARPENKIVKEGFAATWIGVDLLSVGQNEESIKTCQNGIDLMEEQFGSDASKYHVLGHLFHVIGTANRSLGNYSDAESYYSKSIESFEASTDLENESERNMYVKLAKNGLKYAHEKSAKN